MTRRPLVLDANILVRAVLGRRVRELVIAHAQRVAFFTPSACIEDARKHLPELLRKRGIDPESSMQVLDGILRFMQPLETEWLLAAEPQARAGVATWTTATVEHFLANDLG